MSLVIAKYTFIVRKYGLRNTVRKIWKGSIFFSLIHAMAFWYASFQMGMWGERMAALERAFANRDSYWHGVTAVLGFPLGMIEAEGWANFALLILNSVVWGGVLAFILVPAFVKKTD